MALEQFREKISLTLGERVLAANTLILLFNQGGRWPYKGKNSYSDEFILSYLEGRGFVEKDKSGNYKLSKEGLEMAKGLKEVAQKEGRHYLDEWDILGKSRSHHVAPYSYWWMSAYRK